MTAVRYVEKFENLAASLSFAFPLGLYECQEEQGLRTAFSAGVGADFAHDHHGYAAAPKDLGLITVRSLARQSTPALLEAHIDELRAECYRIGLGYLYRLNQDGSTRRRCLARLAAMPGYTINGSWQFGVAAIAPRFQKLSDWMATTPTTFSQKVDVDDETFTVNNPGDLPCDAIIFRFRSDSGGPTNNLSLLNSTNGFEFSTTRDLAAAADELYVDTGKRLVQFSNNDGLSYSNDYGNFTIGPGQGGVIMRLDPGDNILVAGVSSGAPDYTLEGEFTPRYV